MHTAVIRYGFAVISVVFAALVTYWVPWLRHREVFILPVGAVAISAWYGGSGPALTWPALSQSADPVILLLYEPANTLFIHARSAHSTMFFFRIVND